MSYYQGNDLKKITGGVKRRHRKKRKYELGGPPAMTTIASEDVREVVRTMGGNAKVKLKRAQTINVVIPQEGKTVKAKVLDVVEVPSNPQYARAKILVKGALVKTDLGIVKVTSRPGQDGVLNGVLVKKA